MKRPGRELANRPLHFIWMVDCSGSMSGDKISAANYAIKDAIPGMRQAAEENPNAQLLVRALRFDNGASWITPAPTPVVDFDWEPLEAEGLTAMGAAYGLLCDQLEMPPMPERALPPVIVMLSDGNPTDEYKANLDRLLKLAWGKKAVRIAIAIGNDVDRAILEEFTCNPELVLKAENAAQLSSMIKWASTVAKQVSSPVSMAVTAGADGTEGGDMPIDISGIPSGDASVSVW